jgi:glutathione S-transferase/nicotinamidase-related amidase
MAALLLIDLQTDFLSHKQEKPALIDPGPFTRLLPARIREFTTRQLPIIWVPFHSFPSDISFLTLLPSNIVLQIHSAYLPAPHGTSRPFPGPSPSPELQKFESYLTSTHTASRFCTPGSLGAELLSDLAPLKQPNHILIEKSWYSAFTDTSLHENLQSGDVSHLYIAGVTTNTCVAATSVHARRLGYEVSIISDLVFALKLENSQKALNVITASPYDVSLFRSDQISTQLDTNAMNKYPKLYYVNGSIPSWRVMLCLSLKRIPYNAVRLRVMTTPKETRSAEFAAINPRCKTPTLVDVDGTVVIESLAILQYLEKYYSSPEYVSLMGDDMVKKEWTRQVCRVTETENPHNIYEPIELLYLPNWKEHIGAIIQAYHDITAELEFWKKYAKESKFMSGDEFGMVDCAFYPILAYMIHRGLDLTKNGFPALTEYAERCRTLRVVIEARPEGWEEPGKSLFLKCERLIKEKE